MTTYTAKIPGVYLENVPEPRAVELRTGVPVLLGAVTKFPPEVPTDGPIGRLTSSLWSELTRREGASSAPWTRGHLTASLRGFFQNGGRLCYVVSVRDASELEGALSSLSSIDDFDLVAAPGLMSLPAETLCAAQARLLQLCAERGDCFAILDVASSHLSDKAVMIGAMDAHRSGLNAAIEALAGPAREELRRRGALYLPWVRTLDGLAPPSGHIAGIYARTDEQRGFFKAPANEVVEGIVDLEIRLNDREQEALLAQASPSVNCLRAFPGRGVRVWGARTMSVEPAHRHINVQRTVMTVRRWLELMMTDFLFEQNDPRLWIRVHREVSSFLEELYRRGALQGATSSDAYFVKCDAETNPESVRSAGHVVTEVGIAPATPKELIVVRLIHSAGGIVSVSAGPDVP